MPESGGNLPVQTEDGVFRNGTAGFPKARSGMKRLPYQCR
jgi:hypothetical protein